MNKELPVKVILVDKENRKIGLEEKIKAHREGKLHRAFSIFIFNKKGELLLQKRAKSKYHSGGLWANTCCSHPRPAENLDLAVKRRLREEMGIKADLKEIFTLLYNLKVGKLYEHEFNHVLIGRFDGNPKVNPEEVEDWRWIGSKELKNDIRKNPEKYASWFKIILPELLKNWV